MHLREVAVFAAMALGLVSGPARACEFDPFLFQLPGETEAKAHERSDKILADNAVKRHFDRESYDFEKSALIYLARVFSRTAGNFASGVLPSTRVRPMASLKGTLPPDDQTLTDEAQSGMCTDIGDGHGARSYIGELVVVFEGLPKTGERPRGIDSFQVGSIRTFELLDRLREYGKDLDD